jgi:ubiquinone/menaquinone biosynthesis C-methylase UbiE
MPSRGEVWRRSRHPAAWPRATHPGWRVSKVFALEPNPGMLRLAERERHRTQLDITFLELPGERIPLADASVDTVVSTFTLCTIPGVVEALRGVRRVLKPSGKLIFFEHGRAPDPRIRRWQQRKPY